MTEVTDYIKILGITVVDIPVMRIRSWIKGLYHPRIYK